MLKSNTIKFYTYFITYYHRNAFFYEEFTVIQNHIQVRKIPHHNCSMKYLFIPNPHTFFCVDQTITVEDINFSSVNIYIFFSSQFQLRGRFQIYIHILWKNNHCNQKINLHLIRILHLKWIKRQNLIVPNTSSHLKIVLLKTDKLTTKQCHIV